MQNVSGLQCPRCSENYPLKNETAYLVEGCHKCATTESVANLTLRYKENTTTITPSTFLGRENSMWKYSEFLPFDSKDAVTIGEGMTPLVSCKKMAKYMGVGQLYLKDETRNPTWSHKDRAMSVGVTHALERGDRVVTTASSGNEGGALAAYAARAGIEAVIFTSAACPPTMQTLMQVFGAKLIATPTSQDRFTIMRHCVENFGWYPMSGYSDKPIGTNPFLHEGYKTIAFEICEVLDYQVPDYVIVPTCWGDGLHGIWKGFTEFKQSGLIDKLPKMVAAEVFGPLSNALKKDLSYVEDTPSGDSIAISIASGVSTWQALHALLDSNGMAQDVNDDDLLNMQIELASMEGIFAEASSIASIAALKKLSENNLIQNDSRIISVITSSGLKDPDVTRSILPEVPVIEPNLDALEAALRNNYNFDINKLL